jgi:MSHA biogenesis protein MshP
MNCTASRRRQQGFALIAAIVLIVVLAAMAGFVATMSSGQSASQQLEIASNRVDLAAQAGLEWGAYRVLKQGVCVAANTPFVPPANTTLSAATVQVSCTPGGPPHRITVRAWVGLPASPDYIERVKIADFP